jgi:competence protein ComGC
MSMRNNSQAFTRIELLAILVVLCLLCALAVPLRATTRQDADRAGCASNLRQIGRATLGWAGDHGERTPWWTPVSEGGTMIDRAGNAWFEWASLSNELATPRLLACPADTGVRVASGFDSSPTGFFNTGMRANALSYIVGLHTFLDYPKGFLSADRNLRSDAFPASCSSGINNADALITPYLNTRWTNAVHGTVGQALLLDGTVETTTSESLRPLLGVDASDQFGNQHILRAR